MQAVPHAYGDQFRPGGSAIWHPSRPRRQRRRGAV